jgi:soluble lytic murein transglycosylase-like protein
MWAELDKLQRELEQTGPASKVQEIRDKINTLIDKISDALNLKEGFLGNISKGLVGPTAPKATFFDIPEQYRDMFKAAADRFGIPVELLAGVARQESGFNPKAVGPKTRYGTAKGMFQFIDDTAEAYGVKQFDPASSAMGAANYLSDLLNRFGGNQALALAGYNWGEGNVERWLKKGGDFSKMPEETRNYISSILSTTLDNVSTERAGISQDRNKLRDDEDRARRTQEEKDRRLAELKRDQALSDLEQSNDAVAAQQAVARKAEEIKQLDEQYRKNTDAIMAAREKAIREADAAAGGINPAETDMKVKAMQEEERRALADRLESSYQLYIEKLREQFYKENGGQMADARLARLDQAPEGSVTNTERKSAERAQQLAQENTNRQMSVFLLQQQAQLEQQIAQAREAGNTNQVTELANKLQIVNQALQQLPANYQAAGAAEANIAKPDTIARLKEVTNQFLEGLGMKNVKGQWQMTAQAFEGYWMQALNGVGSAMKGLFTNLMSGTMSAKDAFRQFALSIIQNLLNIATQVLTNKILAALFSGSGGLGGGGGFLSWLFPGMGGGAGGVPLPTPNPLGSFYQGTSYIRANNGFNANRDSVHALLQPGEAVLRKSAVQMVGRDGIDFLNGMGNRRYSESQKVANDNKTASNRERAAQQKPMNIWVVTPDQVPPPGPNDFVAAVADNIQRNGSIKTLIKTVASGRM